jgi:hypothetical protein
MTAHRAIERHHDIRRDRIRFQPDRCEQVLPHTLNLLQIGRRHLLGRRQRQGELTAGADGGGGGGGQTDRERAHRQGEHVRVDVRIRSQRRVRLAHRILGGDALGSPRALGGLEELERARDVAGAPGDHHHRRQHARLDQAPGGAHAIKHGLDAGRRVLGPEQTADQRTIRGGKVHAVDGAHLVDEAQTLDHVTRLGRRVDERRIEQAGRLQTGEPKLLVEPLGADRVGVFGERFHHQFVLQRRRVLARFARGEHAAQSLKYGANHG